MLEALDLNGTERVLEVGTGSGYTAAVLTLLAKEVYSVERLPALYQAARERFLAYGYDVRLRLGDGSFGWPEHARYDAILVGARAAAPPQGLIAQLALYGRLVVFVGDNEGQTLVRVMRSPRGGIVIEHLHSPATLQNRSEEKIR